MTADEQKAICKSIAQTCMWGHGGVAACLVEHLQKTVPAPAPWGEAFEANKRPAEIEAVGVIEDADRIVDYIRDGYVLCNYKPGELQIHRPSKFGGGLAKYVLGVLADQFGSVYDQNNFAVARMRAAQAAAGAAGHPESDADYRARLAPIAPNTADRIVIEIAGPHELDAIGARYRLPRAMP